MIFWRMMLVMHSYVKFGSTCTPSGRSVIIGVHDMCKVIAASSLNLGVSARQIGFSSCRLKIVPNNLKGKSKSSQEWLTRQMNDPYVKKAHDMNYRARSAFKLAEIDDKVKILKPGQIVVECGAAPGAWTQVIVPRINSNGQVPRKRIGNVIGVDLLPIAPLEGAVFLSGRDFTNASTVEMIKALVREKIEGQIENGNAGKRHSKTDSVEEGLEGSGGGRSVEAGNLMVDVVLSDMAPNATGQHVTDHHRIVKLVEAALTFAVQNGKPGGHFLAKVWDGSELKKLESCVARFYEKVSRHKPPSSRNDSAETFLLGRFKK